MFFKIFNGSFCKRSDGQCSGACSQGRNGNRRQVLFITNSENVSQGGLNCIGATPGGCRMDDVKTGKSKTAGDYCISLCKISFLCHSAHFLLETGSGCGGNGARDSCTQFQKCIGRLNNSISICKDNIAHTNHYFQFAPFIMFYYTLPYRTMFLRYFKTISEATNTCRVSGCVSLEHRTDNIV